MAEELFGTTLPFLQCGFAHDYALLAVTKEANIQLLGDALGGNADLVDRADALEWYRRPARALAAHGDCMEADPSGSARVIGEPVSRGRTEAEIGEWARYEPTCDAVSADSAVPCICPCDVRGPGHEIPAHALRPHPGQVADIAGIPNQTQLEPAGPTGGDQQRDSPEPPAPAAVVFFGHHDLATLRHLVAENAHRAGMAAQRIADLVFLVHEVAYTTVEQTGARGVMRMWWKGDHLVCEVTSPAVSSGGPFADFTRAANHLLRGVRSWRSRPARRRDRRSAGPGGASPPGPRRGSDGDGRWAGWDLPG